MEAKQYLFETLWNIAIPAEQATREIEEGIEPTKTEIIQDTKVSISRSLDIIKSAKEVLVIWATSKTFVLGMSMGITEIYTDAVRNGAKVRLLIPYGERIDLETLSPQVDIRIADKSLQTKITILIVDKKEVMTWELRDDSIKNPYQAGGVATYSNSKFIASSYATIFESFWKQTELYEQSQNYNKLQNEFINVAAHELRTPIQPIIGLAQILRSRKGDGNKRGDEPDDTILSNAKRLRHLSELILDVTKIESHSLHLKKEMASLNEVITNVTAEYESQIKNKNSNIKLLLSCNDIFVQADKERLSQVFANLLSNAVKFTQEGIITITVERKNDVEAVISVKDTGTGIDPEIFPKLFTKFATKSETGTGLGLFISKSIVEAHGGKIWAESNKDGKGADRYI